MIIASHPSHLGAKGLRSCDRSVCPWTLSTFRGRPLGEVDPRPVTNGIVTTGSSHQRSYHYCFGSIEEASMIIASHLSYLSAKDLGSCSWLV